MFETYLRALPITIKSARGNSADRLLRPSSMLCCAAACKVGAGNKVSDMQKARVYDARYV